MHDFLWNIVQSEIHLYRKNGLMEQLGIESWCSFLNAVFLMDPVQFYKAQCVELQ